MSKVVINTIQIEQKIQKAAANNKALEALAYNTAKRGFDVEKRIMLGNFNNHPVTQELEEGSNASSRFLNNGNLFSFIGFEAGDNPTEILYDALNDQTRLLRFPRRKNIMKHLIRYWFGVQTPAMEELYKITSPYPGGWNTGSWLRGIEKGISGLRHYLYKAGELLTNSRSGPAIQVKGTTRSETFRGVRYVSEILERFITKLQTKL